MSLANISCENRWEDTGHALLAILPTFEGSDLTHAKKLEYLHKCLELVLKPLKEASFNGLSLIDPFGNAQFVYPLLYAYISDHPEGCKVSGTYDTNMCKSPCSICMCGRDDLSNVGKRFSSRTEVRMKEVYDKMKEIPKTKAEELAKAWSLHPVKCALWDFNGSMTSTGNPYQALHVDVLHQSDLGIFKMLVGILRDMGQQILRVLDERLGCIREESRFPSFRLPGNKFAGYFSSPANYVGFEHRAVLQVIIFCMLGLYEEPIVEAMGFFLEWYVIACRSLSHTESSLQAMDDLMVRAVESLKRAMFDYQSSGFNTIKIHMMSHFSSCIKRSGLPWEYSTNMYEHFHIALMKAGYRSSNKRNATEQIIRHNKRLECLRKAEKNVEGFKDKVMGKVQSCFKHKALVLGNNVLSSVFINLHRGWLQPGRCDWSQTPHASVHDIRMGRGYEVACISKGVQNLLIAQPELCKEFMPALEAFESLNNITISQVLGLCKSLAIPPGPGEKFADWPMYARATSCFHGKPWFSNVTFEVAGNVGNALQICYGQIRLLFQASGTSVNIRQHDRVQLELAFLKLYTEIDMPQDNWGTLTKCIQLRWSSRSSVRDVQHSARGNNTLELKPRYMVIHTSSILRAIHLVPNFVVEGHFFVNRWKF